MRLWYLPTYAGPIFTFAVMWAGALLLRRARDVRWRSLGLCLVFANLPLGRIATAAMGGGDEVYATRHLLQNRPLGWTVGLIAVLALSSVPLLSAWRAIANPRRWVWFAAFLAAPLFLDWLVVFRGLNPLLERGVLARYSLPCEPLLITVWTALLVAGLLMGWRGLSGLADGSSASAT